MNDPAPDRSGRNWRAVQATLLVLAGAFFLFSMRSALNPFILYCVFVALLTPFRGIRGQALLVTVATVLICLWVLSTAGSLLAPFFLAFVLAYILDPVADRVSAHPRIGRTAAILLILVPFLALGAVAVVFGVPELVSQARDFVLQAPRALEELTNWVRGLTPESLGFDLPFVDEPAALAWIQQLDSQSVAELLESRREELTRRAWAAVLGLGRGFGTLVTILGYLVLTPVLMFYLLRDYDRIIARARDLLPGKLESRVSGYAREFDDLLSRYLRGQVSASLITGGITWLGLLIVGFPYAFLLGATVAVLGVIPYMGVAVSLVPAVIIALVSDSVGISLIKVAAVYGVAQGLESAVISPRIVGESVGLHPVWIVLALSLGGFYFGFVGLLIGVPLAVAAKLLLVRGLERYKNSALYKEGTVLSR
ncbi:MAG: AI-2E family transporter [Gemmatimonadetes bacterium]|nr:AI-2E family transporter [Gemmatimonadota bacterium]MYE17541.1 AI-2E family transporter [Gemmatimonadota bacterium]MYG20934.1 AI-2E family transporter [Gemmatimonadota bacterium]MYJ39237.1 AI-2E family transporter [Gemmatimonadota bacterium]